MPSGSIWRHLEAPRRHQEAAKRHPGSTQEAPRIFVADAWRNVAQRGGCARRVRWFNSFSLTPLMGSRTSVPGTSTPAKINVCDIIKRQCQQTQKRLRRRTASRGTWSKHVCLPSKKKVTNREKKAAGTMKYKREK